MLDTVESVMINTYAAEYNFGTCACPDCSIGTQ